MVDFLKNLLVTELSKSSFTFAVQRIERTLDATASTHSSYDLMEIYEECAVSGFTSLRKVLHHISFMESGHVLTLPGLTYPEVSSKVYHDFFCQLGGSISLPWVICPASFRETCQWLNFPLNGLRA